MSTSFAQLCYYVTNLGTVHVSHETTIHLCIMIVMYAPHEVGRIGEDIACRYLEKKGYCILDRNYRLKCGEIDIVCMLDEILCFVEVKTVSREKKGASSAFRPEDQLHQSKIDRLERAIEVYITDTQYDGEWKLVGIMIELYPTMRTARVRLLDDFAWRG